MSRLKYASREAGAIWSDSWFVWGTVMATMLAVVRFVHCIFGG